MENALTLFIPRCFFVMVGFRKIRGHEWAFEGSAIVTYEVAFRRNTAIWQWRCLAHVL